MVQLKTIISEYPFLTPVILFIIGGIKKQFDHRRRKNQINLKTRLLFTTFEPLASLTEIADVKSSANPQFKNKIFSFLLKAYWNGDFDKGDEKDKKGQDRLSLLKMMDKHKVPTV